MQQFFSRPETLLRLRRGSPSRASAGCTLGYSSAKSPISVSGSKTLTIIDVHPAAIDSFIEDRNESGNDELSSPCLDLSKRRR
jgi:hypothetical protein